MSEVQRGLTYGYLALQRLRNQDKQFRVNDHLELQKLCAAPVPGRRRLRRANCATREERRACQTRDKRRCSRPLKKTSNSACARATHAIMRRSNFLAHAAFPRQRLWFTSTRSRTKSQLAALSGRLSLRLPCLHFCLRIFLLGRKSYKTIPVSQRSV